MHDAAEYGHPVHPSAVNADIAKTENIIRRRANVDAQAKDSKTVMRYAALNNRLDVVQMLDDATAGSEVKDNKWNTRIYFVVEQPERYALAKYMVQKGVSFKHKNKAGVDPLETAVNSPSNNGDTYLTLAVSRSVVLLHLLGIEKIF